MRFGSVFIPQNELGGLYMMPGSVSSMVIFDTVALFAKMSDQA